MTDSNYRTRINRRHFMQMLAALSLQWPLMSHSFSRAPDALQLQQNVYHNLKDPWLTLSEVQEHLFPADEESPGARDIMALRFLQNMLDAPDTDEEEKNFILNGVNWLNDLASKQHQAAFVKLDSEQREMILRTVEKSRAGSRWLSLMMTYLIEALLSDPVYGGNFQQKGWTWLEHIPGFPTPGTDKVYFKLGGQASTRRRTKA